MAFKFPHLPTTGTADSTKNFEMLQKLFKESARWHVVGEDLGMTVFEHEWVNFEAARKAEYSIDGWGYVHLRGVLKAGKTGESAFVLPEGFRPKAAKAFIIVANGNTGYVEVMSTGGVVPVNVGGEVKISAFLDAVTFSVN